MDARNQKGFTLLEILMVVMIIMLSGAVIFPLSSDLIKKWSSEKEVVKLRNKIREVQQKAIMEEKVYGMEFNLSFGMYTVREDTTNDGNPESVIETIYPQSPVNLTGAAWAGSSPVNVVTFDAFGAPSDGGFINFGNSNGDPVTVWIEAVTGKVSINWN